MYKRRADTKCTSGYMYIEAGIIKIALKEQASLFYKIEFFAERKIRKRIIDEQQTKTSYGHPEKHLEKNLRGSLEGGDSRVLHTVGLF